MKYTKTLIGVTTACALLSACAMTPAQSAADLNAAFNLAAVGEAAYSAQPNANPKTVAELKQLLSAAQAALLTWTNEPGAGNLAAVNAAIAALVAYEAAAKTGS